MAFPHESGGRPARKELDRKGGEGPSGHQVEHEPVMCPRGKESK